MKRGQTGRYEVSVGGGERVRAFVPAPLPPAPPLVMDGPRQRRYDAALLAIGRLDVMATILPDPGLFLYAYVRKEAVLSSQIEGTQSSLSDLLLFEAAEAPGVPIDDVLEVSSYVAALDHGVRRLREGFPLSNRLLREVHAILLERGRGTDKMPGEFRRSQNWIGGTRPGNAAFVPPPPHLVAECMGELERFFHPSEDGLSPLLTAALAHVQFETIHPFLDGNGRLGRLLIALILHEKKLLKEPFLYLSLFFKKHRAQYYELLDRVRYEGDWEAWIDFFLEGVEETATGAVESARRIQEILRRDADRIAKLGRGATNVLRLHQCLSRRPISSIGDLANVAGIAYPTASRGVQSMVKLGVLEELTGRARDRIFAYRGYLSILGEQTEPLR